MRHRRLWVVLPLLYSGLGGVQMATADIYTWVDASGRVTISNLDPPDDVRVTNVMHTVAPTAPSPDDAARERLREAEVQALADRVRQLQDDVAAARRDAVRQVEEEPRVIPPPAIVQYVSNWAPPPMQYVEAAPPPMQYVSAAPTLLDTGCDPSWNGCGLGWWPGVYGTGVVIVAAPTFRHVRPVHDNRRPLASRQPVHGSGLFAPQPPFWGPRQFTEQRPMRTSAGGRGH